MNELIQKFAEQADLFADSKLLMKGEFHPDWHDIRDEKFATLIVLECAKLIEDNIDPQNAWITPGYVKQHFGIEL
jgi:hypothetical protein